MIPYEITQTVEAIFTNILFSVQNEPVEADLASNIIIVSGWFFSMTHSELRVEGPLTRVNWIA